MAEAKAAEAEQTNGAGRVVVVDLGKKKRKQVKRLRRGEGRLMDDVREVVAELQAEGESQPGDTVVVVVERKQRRMKPPFRW